MIWVFFKNDSYIITNYNSQYYKQPFNFFAEAVRRRFPDATNGELESLTGKSLTRSCDRGGMKQEREERRRQERDERQRLEAERGNQTN